MTNFTGPLSVAQPNSETTNVTIDASGTATFSSEVIASASVRFTGPVRVGSGYAYLAQTATVSHSNSAGSPVTFTLPVGSDIVEFYIDVVNNFAAGALTTAANLEIGVSGSTTMFAVVPVSASGTRALGSTHRQVTIKRWQSFTSNVGNGDASGVIQAFVTAQSLATSMTVGELLLTVVYIQKC